ncbi:hypothetical protein BH09BAC1_BH09BAC1_04080 [soil metagenome]
MQTTTLIEVDSLYKEVVDIYHRLNNSGKHLNSLREKYQRLEVMVRNANAVIKEFPQVSKELNDLITSRAQDEITVDWHLANLQAVVSNLDVLKLRYKYFTDLPQVVTPIVPDELRQRFSKLKASVTIATLSNWLQATEKDVATLKNLQSDLEKLHNRLRLLENNIVGASSGMFAIDKQNIAQKATKVKTALFNGLTASFLNQGPIIDACEVDLRNAVNLYNGRQNEASNLRNSLSSMSTNLWLGDLNAMQLSIAELANNKSNKRPEQIMIEIKQMTEKKGKVLSAFNTRNEYLLQKNVDYASKYLQLKSTCCEVAEFEAFRIQVEKWATLKKVLYALGQISQNVWSFLTRKSTMKFLGIGLVVVVGIAIVLSIWMYILAGLAVIFVLGAIFKR